MSDLVGRVTNIKIGATADIKDSILGALGDLKKFPDIHFGFERRSKTSGIDPDDLIGSIGIPTESCGIALPRPGIVVDVTDGFRPDFLVLTPVGLLRYRSEIFSATNATGTHRLGYSLLFPIYGSGRENGSDYLLYGITVARLLTNYIEKSSEFGDSHIMSDTRLRYFSHREIASRAKELRARLEPV